MKTTVSPHTLHLGDHVYQRVNPWNQGTVTRSDAMSFTVTYDGHARRHGEPRIRHTYPASYQEDFLLGTPNPDLLIWEKEIEATDATDG